MAPASSQTVLGNFEGATFSYAGSTSRFYRSDGHYFVRTDGPDGTMADFQIKYTFGVYPLQQYLVELAGGRLQALSIAWDARATKEGGQRWFHLYPDERVTHADELHWTRPSQNWNFMCADCHSTAVRKNYDAVADRFATRWSEISVGCEACHGPGSNHVTWAGQSNGNRKKAASYKGLNVRLDERNAVTWKRNAATGNSTRSRVRATEREIEVCAQCHSRRRQVAEGYVAGKPFLDFYRPALLTQPLYHSDGQQRDEVYNWGSFLQSRMYAAGVSCSDCHNPHSGKLRVQGNAVCASCHLPGKYDTPDHHHHKTGSTGAACASCHMPPATYMVIDPRHDHSLRTPRPDLTVKYGTPNACSVCHKTRSASWAAARVQDWFGPARTPDQRDQIAAAFSEADTAAQRQQLKLRALSADRALPVITRATALAALDLAAQQSVPEILAAFR